MGRVKATEDAGGTAVADEAAGLQTSANGPGHYGQGLQYVPVKGLLPSPLNPRKTFDEAKLKELAESIKSLGILEPLLVRWVKAAEIAGAKVSEHYEVIAGERRWRAAKLAKLETVPCIVREMTDVEALEVMVVENQQRVDVSPLEEAVGYKTLMDLGKYDVPAIAKKVGMSTSHVYQRMKLAELIEPGKQLLAEGHITPGHAILIARLQPADQDKALTHCFRTTVTQASQLVEFVEQAEKEAKKYGYEEGMGLGPVISVRDLGAWIEEEIHCELKDAKFPKDSAELVPAAGPCTLCPKRTGANPDLFTGKEDRCTDPTCFKKKCAAFVKLQEEKVKEQLDEGEKVLRVTDDYRSRKGVLSHWDYEKVKKSDKGAVAAVNVDTGAVEYVKPKAEKAAAKKASMTPEERAEHERKINEKIKAEDLRRKLIFKALAAKLPKQLTREHLFKWADDIYLDGDAVELVSAVIGKKCDASGLKKLNEGELQRFIIIAEMAQRANCEQEYDLDRNNYEVKKLYEAAKEYKVDLKAIDAEVDNQLTGTLPAKPEETVSGKDIAAAAKKARGKGKAKAKGKKRK